MGEPAKPPPILAATSWVDNAAMIADIIRLGYLNPATDDVADLTYGEGNWWTDATRPRSFVCHDKYKLDGVDFCDLPEVDGVFDVVAYDPPYTAIGGKTTTTIPDFHDDYGLDQAPETSSPATLQALINTGLGEVRRVLRPPHRVEGEYVGGIAIVKCMNYVTSGSLWPGAHYTLVHALSLGFKVEEIWPHVGRPGPQPKNRTRKHWACKGRGCGECDEGQVPSVQQHAANNYSMCYVLRRDREMTRSLF